MPVGVAVIRSKATGAGFKYTIAASWLPKLIAINKKYDPMGRYDAVMSAADLFRLASSRCRPRNRRRNSWRPCYDRAAAVWERE